MKTKLTTAFLFAACIMSASQIVGVTVNPGQLQFGAFPTGPLELTLQFANGTTQMVEGYEYVPTTFVPQTSAWPDNYLTLHEAETEGLQASGPNGAFNYLVAAALAMNPPSLVNQLAIWMDEDVTNMEYIPYQSVPNDAAAAQEIAAAQSLVLSGSLNDSNFVVLDATANLWESPSFIVDLAAPVPTSTPEPAACWMIGVALAGLGMRRKRARRIGQR